MISYEDLKKKSKELEIKYKLSHYELLQRFMFERLLERISVSKYKSNFILKGGLLLTAMFGIDNRTTKDMDTTIKGISIEPKVMQKVLEEIFDIDLKDYVKFEIKNITNIRNDDIYGGNKYHVLAKMNNLNVNLEIDISTGDSVIPKELNYSYQSIFEDKKIFIQSYNLETILAEKIETILRRGLYNSRMKDFYDAYIIINKKNELINMKACKAAIKNTIDKRKSYEIYKDYDKILENIKEYERIHLLWNNYSKKNKYATNIELDDIIFKLKSFIEEVNLLKK